MFFISKEPKMCDCGCFIASGESYIENTITVVTQHKMHKKITVSSCMYDDHQAISMFNAVKPYMDRNETNGTDMEESHGQE